MKEPKNNAMFKSIKLLFPSFTCCTNLLTLFAFYFLLIIFYFRSQFGESALLKPMLGTGSGLFHTFSPISVLEGSNTCPVENEKTLDLKTAFPVKRARSKRRRPLFFNPWLAISVVPPPRKRYHSLSGRNFKSVDITETPFPVKRKQQIIDPSVLETSEMKKHPPQQPVLTRKCTHCETTETPQWREGPLGPKTLCNACGVRYRTGRLFPEYRPAASPTFVESLHSNSHKKVVEMRRAKHSTT